MEFRRTVYLGAPIRQVWALTDEIPAVADCIPGLGQIEMQGDHAFDCVMNQRVGSVQANFQLHNVIQDMDPERSLTVVSEGKDKNLNSHVKATQRFDFTAEGDKTQIEIVADIQVTGRIATFGHRIISAKAEQVTVQALRNVETLLEQRQAGTAG